MSTRQEDFVYDVVVKEALRKGAMDRFAHIYAETARAAYRQNRFKKPSSLIADSIKKAVADTKKFKQSQLVKGD